MGQRFSVRLRGRLQGGAALTAPLLAALVLSGCEMHMPSLKGKPADGGAVATSIPGDSTAGDAADGARDVENAKIFGMTAKGLWDGRPSLGGVWVAHTSVKDPQRVIIRNEANGKSVVGALFRREIDNPGPPLQLSSDAAEALGMIAGQPASLRVTALERVEPTPAPPPVPSKPVATTDVAAATAKPGAPATAPAKPGAIATETLTGTAAAAIEKAAGKPGTKPTALPATTPAPAAKPAPTTTPTTTPTATAAPADAALKRAYVQVGIFSVEANAEKAAQQMKKAGFKASVRPDQSQGKSFWRVIIGPATSVADRDAMAAKVKGLGYPDSYPVSR